MFMLALKLPFNTLCNLIGDSADEMNGAYEELCMCKDMAQERGTTVLLKDTAVQTGKRKTRMNVFIRISVY